MGSASSASRVQPLLTAEKLHPEEEESIDYRAQLADRDGQLAVLLPQLSVAAAALDHARRERNELRRHFERCSDEHEGRVSNLVSECEELRTQLEASRAALAVATEQAEHAQQQSELRAELERTLTGFERERDELLEKRDAVIDTLRAACDSLERQLQEVKAGQAGRSALLEKRFAEAVGARDARIAALSGDAHRLEKSQRQLRERHDQLVTELDELRDAAQQAASDRAEAQRALVHREELLRERAREVEELRHELAAVRPQASVPVPPQASVPVPPQASVPAPPQASVPAPPTDDDDSAWTDSFEPDTGDWSRTPPPDAELANVAGKRRG
jgi:chromosome segregation ATPase